MELSKAKMPGLSQRYRVYALMGDDVRELYASAKDDPAEAVAQAVLYDRIDIFGRVLVQDDVTGEIIVCFESGKPIDPAKLVAT